MSRTFTIGGIHPPQNKNASREIVLQPLPYRACLPLRQHIGAAATPCVGKGDKVKRGEVVALAPSYVSAAVHAPISGTVEAIEEVTMPDGKPARAIVIKASEEEHIIDSEAREAYWAEVESAEKLYRQTLGASKLRQNPSDELTAEDILGIVSASGIVGLGGATFPSHVKLKPATADTGLLIINGCECEPYLMCDDALMNTYPALIVEGIRLMMKACGVRQAVVAVGDNKPEAISALRDVLADDVGITISAVRTKYPQGGEKQLVETVLGRRIPSGALPASVGAIVHNVSTAFAIWQAVVNKTPLIERVVTVTGDIPTEQRCNYIAAIGTPMSEFDFTLPVFFRAIVGGPMMGRTAVNLDAPVMKCTSGLLLLEGKGRRPSNPCIRCGECVEACPMGLEPYLLSTYGRLHRFDDAREAKVADCIECGSCSYVCPSSRPLLDYIRLAKQRSRK